MMGYVRLFPRLAGQDRGCSRTRWQQTRGGPALWGRDLHRQALLHPVARGPVTRSQAASRSSPHHPPGPAGGAPGSSDRASGCLSGRALPPLGSRNRCVGEHLRHEPGDPEAGIHPKKRTMGASERNEERRRIWHRIVHNLDARRLVFLDESGANITLARRYGRAPRGERSRGTAPRKYGRNLTLVAALSLTGLDAPMLLDGALDTRAFERYVERFLVPRLRPGQLVILDNLAVHRQARIRQAISSAGCRVLFLPSYSPDFNPIE